MPISGNKAILFDFDGVLLKSMEDHFQAWEKAAKDFGLKIVPDDYFPIEGMSLIEIAKKFCRMANIDEAHYGELVRKKEDYFLQNKKFELYPYVEEFIDLLREKKIPIAIVTAGLHNRLMESVPKEFLDKFNAVITGDKTEKGKPFPDPYLKGAEELGIDIKNCIVVENAPMGIQAAKSAGAYCIAVCSTLKEDKLSEADEIIKEFKDLKDSDVIKSLLI